MIDNQQEVDPSVLRSSLPPLRRDRRVLGWALAHGVSSFGDQILYVAVVFTAAQVTSPAVAGMIVACAVLPNAVLTLFAGAVVDRTDARRTMLVSDTAQVLVLLGAVAVLLVYGPSAALLVALALAYGVASAFYDPASFAFPRQLRPKEDLTQVAGIRQFTGRAAAIAGPPLGGVLIVGIGLAGALLVDAMTFVVIAVVLLLTRPRWPRARSAGATMMVDVRDGLAYVMRQPRVRNLVIALAGLNVFAAPVTTVGLALRSTGEGWGAAGLGLLLGAIGAAALLGSMVMIRLRVNRPIQVALLILLVQAAALVYVGFAPFAGTLLAASAIGLTAGLASPLLAGAFQATVDDEYVARAGSVTGLADSALTPLSLVGFGVLVGLTSVPFACAVCGIGFAVQLAYSLSRFAGGMSDAGAASDEASPAGPAAPGQTLPEELEGNR
jgi:MFS family permease